MIFTVIKATLGCLLGATTNQSIVAGGTITLQTATGTKDIDIVYVRESGGVIKVQNSNLLLWLKEIV